MVQTLEAIKGGGGSIKVGTTGTIIALMTRELESLESSQSTPKYPRSKHQTVAVSVPCKATRAKTPQLRKSLDTASSSIEGSQRTKDYNNNHRVSTFGARDLALGGTRVREKPERRGRNIVEVVDITCRNPKLKKLGFSKLSESII